MKNGFIFILYIILKIKMPKIWKTYMKYRHDANHDQRVVWIWVSMIPIEQLSVNQASQKHTSTKDTTVIFLNIENICYYGNSDLGVKHLTSYCDIRTSANYLKNQSKIVRHNATIVGTSQFIFFVNVTELKCRP